MHRKQIYLFDLDGTLTDPGQGITNSVMYALDKFGIHETDRTALYKFIGPPLLDSFQIFYRMSPEQAEQAVAAYREYFSVTGLFENRVYEGIPALLQVLRAEGKTLAMATSKPEIFAVRILEKFDLAKYFHYVGAASLDSSRSQKADVIRHALHLCGDPDPDTVLMIGDRKHDILGAIENKIQSVGVLYGYGDRPELEQAGADAIAESVIHLKELLLSSGGCMGLQK